MGFDGAVRRSIELGERERRPQAESARSSCSPAIAIALRKASSASPGGPLDRVSEGFRRAHDALPAERRRSPRSTGARGERPIQTQGKRMVKVAERGVSCADICRHRLLGTHHREGLAVHRSLRFIPARACSIRYGPGPGKNSAGAPSHNGKLKLARGDGIAFSAFAPGARDDRHARSPGQRRYGVEGGRSSAGGATRSARLLASPISVPRRRPCGRAATSQRRDR